MVSGTLCVNYLDSSDNYSNGYSNGSTSKGYATILASSSSINSSPLKSSCSPSSSSALGYIEHRVSRMDTLAGVAIKYGVEVADIRRMNGLVTDLQMFALDTLRIPLPGRHPPSPILLNGATDNGDYQTASRRAHEDVVNSLQCLKLKPPRRAALQGYYNLKTPPKPKKFHQIGETEMSTYTSNKTPSQVEDTKNTSLNKHRKSRSLVSLDNIQETDTSVRRRQKCDSMDSSAPEIIIKDESYETGLLGRIGRGLALRPKLGARSDSTSSSSTPIGDFFNDVFVAMRRSSSTSSLQESENMGGSFFVWPTSISRPVFDGRKNKAALD